MKENVIYSVRIFQKNNISVIKMATDICFSSTDAKICDFIDSGMYYSHGVIPLMGEAVKSFVMRATFCTKSPC